MAKITRNDFKAQLAGKSIDVDKAKQDPRLANVDLKAADLDKDGKISGDAELDKLFLEVDKYDRDGSYGSMQMHNGDGSQNVVGEKVQALAEQTNSLSLRMMAMTGQLPASGKSNDDIMLVGMNAGSSHEASQLRSRGNQVSYVRDNGDDQITAGGKTHDLTTTAGVKDFVATLGLPAAQSAKVESAIKGAGDDARDEAAQIAQVWAKGELGGEVPGRLILSGHSVGDGVWGDDNGYLSRDSIAALAEAMPQASRQVEDLQIAGCYSGGQSDMQTWKGIFPKAKTIWAYTGSAPGSFSGAVAHQSRWDTATRGDKDDIDRNIIANRGIRKGDNVAIWTEKSGYNDGVSTRPPVDTLRSRVSSGDAAFQDFFRGERVVTDTQSGPMRAHYNNIQSLRQHPDLPAAELGDVDKSRDATIRLIYFDKHVKGKFNAHYSAQIQAGFSAMGQAAPDFSSMSRKDCVISAESFAASIKGDSPQAAKDLAGLLTGGLRDLNAAMIPETWI